MYIHRKPTPNKKLATLNPYETLVDNTASHNYLDKEAIPHCSITILSFGSHIKVANGNIIISMSKATINITPSIINKNAVYVHLQQFSNGILNSNQVAMQQRLYCVIL